MYIYNTTAGTLAVTSYASPASKQTVIHVPEYSLLTLIIALGTCEDFTKSLSQTEVTQWLVVKFVSFFRKEITVIASYTDHILAYILSLYIQPSYSSYLDDERQDVVSYPLGHLNASRSDRGNNRNDRNRNQNNRDRYRGNNNNSRQNNRGPPNQGPGILGAKPGDRTVPELPTNPLQVPGLVWLYLPLICHSRSL